ncbi:ABC transporter ATP-binding protein [Acuticoccus sediminis]|uniref:ABC transporter ATP-binding protein n=1 Tax=Acuticoccus sediminis TaxID=2184697 RepID=UPI0011B936B5|nr:ABC transporter ATP-binding protein [Acuticoccus sediminis]
MSDAAINPATYKAATESRVGRAGTFPSPERQLFHNFCIFAIRTTWRSQVIASALGLLILVLTYINLELVKTTINSVIDSGHFPVEIFGSDVSQFAMLLIMIGTMMVLAAIQSGFRFAVNMLQGRMCEQILIVLRRNIYSVWTQRRVKRGGSGIIPLLSQEVEPIGGFAGEMIILPLIQVGLFLTVVVFIMAQSFILAIAMIALIPLQLCWTAWMQTKLSRTWRDRIRLMRILAAKVSRASSGATGMEHVFCQMQNNRCNTYRIKFLMKAGNAYSIGVSGVIVIGLGGYLVMNDGLTVGVIAVALGAHKDLSSAFRELLRYRQMCCDVSVRCIELERHLGSSIH